MVKKWFLGWLMGLLPMLSIAQNVLIDAEIRPRSEFRDGYKSLNVNGKDPGIFTSQRTRLGLSYTSALMNASVSLQDSRIWGQYANSSSDATTGLFEAWAELLLVQGGTLKIGRQAVKYDDNRLFSASSWSLTGVTHDMALFKYNLNDWQFHFGMAYNNSSEISSETLYPNTDKYRSLAFAWLTKDIVPGLNFSAIVVDEGVQDTVGVGTNYKQIKMNHLLTYGGNLKYQTPDNRFSLYSTAYFQGGKSSKGKTIDGLMAALKANYQINHLISVNLGTDYFSGDANSTDNKQTNFKKLYGTNHAFNGTMDYWNTPLDQGLLDIYGGIVSKIGKSTSCEAAYHVFSTDKPLSSGGKDLGTEFDLTLNYKLNAQTNLQAGWSCYFKTENTLVAKRIAAGSNVEFPQWAFVMLTIKPTFLNTATSSK